jgi:hypothetical protein
MSTYTLLVRYRVSTKWRLVHCYPIKVYIHLSECDHVVFIFKLEYLIENCFRESV